MLGTVREECGRTYAMGGRMAEVRPHRCPGDFRRWDATPRCHTPSYLTLVTVRKEEVTMGEFGPEIDELRARLFFEQRRWRHFDVPPDEATWAYLIALLEELRRWVSAKSPS